ncbi:hypothetical protein [uncultured Sphingomonas sp.]|uniref:hypothetical protein n=1 Tax=uncultured Sphingomonas sp. TaxID=158754 RepID=UPI0025F8DC2C|nr:hypothetical protein [uncultured Sphingomonas sp.]
MRQLLLAGAAVGLLAASPVVAAPCNASKTGKFINCPTKGPMKVARCKAVNGKFAKCGTPGAKPI